MGKLLEIPGAPQTALSANQGSHWLYSGDLGMSACGRIAQNKRALNATHEGLITDCLPETRFFRLQELSVFSLHLLSDLSSPID